MKVVVIQVYTLEIPEPGTPERLELVARYDELYDTINLLSEEDVDGGVLPSDDHATMILATGEIENASAGNGSDAIKAFAEQVVVDGRVVTSVKLDKEHIIRTLHELREEEL